MNNIRFGSWRVKNVCRNIIYVTLSHATQKYHMPIFVSFMKIMFFFLNLLFSIHKIFVYIIIVFFFKVWDWFLFSNFRGNITSPVTLEFIRQHPTLVDILPSTNVSFGPDLPISEKLTLLGKKPGHLNIETSVYPNGAIEWVFILYFYIISFMILINNIEFD